MKLQRLSLAVAGLLCVVAAQASTLSPEQQAVHVLNRIAFGPKPGDIERVAQMGVQRYIDQQLNPESLAYPQSLRDRLAADEAANRSAGDLLGEFVTLRKEVKNEEEGAKQKRREGIAKIVRETADARLARAIDSPRQLEEVMVDFWFNHFNVFDGKGEDRVFIASYERDAIRPYVFGSFRDLLGATAHHPAMLYYLDNFLSTANGYVPPGRANAPKAKAHGLNENYARELMELHTLGVDGGYTQKDVTELARMLTGWSYDQRELIRSNTTFHFDAKRHDQGVKHWLGREVAENGQREGEMALDLLAVHPSTAHHISYKLAQYFVQDEPPPALVERMAKTWLDSKGDIRSVLKTMFYSDEFMALDAIGAKFKTPYQFVVSAARASATPVTNIGPLMNTMNALGMPLYGCQTPDGYKNTQAAWLNPDALTRRITFATSLAAGQLPLSSLPDVKPAPPAVSLDAASLKATLGGAISPATLSTVAASAPPLRAAMLLGSPDFMLR